MDQNDFAWPPVCEQYRPMSREEFLTPAFMAGFCPNLNHDETGDVTSDIRNLDKLV